MKNIPKLALFSLLFSSVELPIGIGAIAAEVNPVPAQTPVARIEEAPRLEAGDWNLGGRLTLQKNHNVQDDSTEFSLATQAEHFFYDRFSLGLTMSLSAESGTKTAAVLGPSFTWYYFKGGRYALHLGGETLFGLTESTVDSILTARTGVQCFLTSSVAFGPSLFFSHYSAGSFEYDRYGVSFGFEFYL